MIQLLAGASSNYVMVGYLAWGLIVGCAAFFSLGSLWEYLINPALGDADPGTGER
jgi:hypothetical protein